MASSKNSVATAVVTLTVEVRANGSWGGDCKLDQIESQAAQSAIGYLEGQCDKDRRIKIIGTPKVSAIITRNE